MDLLDSGNLDLPPVGLSTLIDPCEVDGGDDWLVGIKFTPAARRSAAPTPSPACPIPCGLSSAPVPIAAPGRMGPAWAPSAPSMMQHHLAADCEVVDSWESSQSLLASALMDDYSQPSTTGLLAQAVAMEQPSSMVPVEEAGSWGPYDGLSAASATAPPPLAPGYASSYPGTMTTFSTAALFEAASLLQVAHAAGFNVAAFAPGLTQPPPQLPPQLPSGPPVSAPQPSGFSWRSASAPQLMSLDHAYYNAEHYGPVAGSGMVPVSSNASLPTLEVATAAAAAAGAVLTNMCIDADQHSDSLTAGSDVNTMLQRHGSTSPLSAAHAPLPAAPAMHRSPASAKARCAGRSRGLQPLKQGSRQRSFSSLHSAVAGCSGGGGPRPVRSAARRSLALTNAAADLVDTSAEDTSDTSVDLGSADDAPSSGASGGSAGAPLSGASKKKHNPWSLTETEALVEGVRIVGPGKWAEIKKLPIAQLTGLLVTRSPVDLKDKWRNLTRVARLPKSALKQRMAKSASEIPLELILQVKDLMEQHGP